MKYEPLVWIDLAKQPPVFGDHYIVCGDGYSYLAYWDEHQGVFCYATDVHRRIFENISHWMHMPKSIRDLVES